MPYLSCETHGKEHEALTRKRQGEYRQEGESVLVVNGTLISGPWRCDRCNARLGRGNRAWLVTAFPRNFAEDLGGYDYGDERRYFAMGQAEVTLYGA